MSNKNFNLDPMWQDFTRYLKNDDIEGLNILNNCVNSRLKLYKEEDNNLPWVIQIKLLNYVLQDVLQDRYERFWLSYFKK